MNKKNQYVAPYIHSYKVLGPANILFSSGKTGSFSKENEHFIKENDEEENL